MTEDGISRRVVLGGLGGIAVGLPLFDSMFTSSGSKPASSASRVPYPKRFIVFFQPNGVIPASWFPRPGETESEFELGPVHRDALSVFRSDLIFLRGVDMIASDSGPGDEHQRGMGTVLTGRPLLPGDFVGGTGLRAGWASGPSIDQRIAAELSKDTPFRSLELGVRATGGEVRHRLSYIAAGRPLPAENDPAAVFRRLFAGRTTDAERLGAILSRRRSVLDAVTRELDRVSKELGVGDRLKLEAHLELLRDVERRLERDYVALAETLERERCGPRNAPARILADDENAMPIVSRVQIDLLVMALACDLARVATIQYSNAENHIRFPWIASLGDGHALSHAGPSASLQNEEYEARTKWYAGEFAYLLGRLGAVPEGDGTLLDNTAVLWVSELAYGSTHSHLDMPFVLAGGAGGALRTGRYVRFEHRPHNELLVSLLHAMGIAEDAFGEPGIGTGPLPGLV